VNVRALLALLALSSGLAATGLVAGGPAAAATRSRPAPATVPAPGAAVHAVGTAAQSAAGTYWTPARMASATPVTPPRAPASALAPSSEPEHAAASTPQPPPGTPDPTYFNGVPTVGALFFTTGSQAHFCTASVVDSPTLNLVLTAAHCVYGSGYATNIAYVPEWHSGVSPYGVWPVQSITVASGWRQSQDPDLDFAFLKVAPPSGEARPVQLVTGGLLLGINAGYAHPVYVIGYNDTDSQPIGCATRSFEFEPTQIEFYCNSFWDGTSGGPWITHFNPATGTGVVIGDIGGYDQGGDYPWASYSDYYTWPTMDLYLQAEASQA